jgi:hypothetical protein
MTFALDLKKFAQRATIQADDAVRKIVLDVGTSLVLKSPVGDMKLWADYWKEKVGAGYVGGRFRGNWQFGVGQIDTTTDLTIDPTGSISIGRIANGVLSAPAANVFYITNSLPYADRLENGWSSQAPAGMVGLTVAEFQGIVKSALVGLDASAAAAVL